MSPRCVACWADDHTADSCPEPVAVAARTRGYVAPDREPMATSDDAYAALSDRLLRYKLWASVLDDRCRDLAEQLAVDPFPPKVAALRPEPDA